MSIIPRIINRVGLVTKAQAQERVNKAREDMRGEPSRTEQPLWKPFDANQRPGKLPYSILRAYADQCEPARLCINRIKVMMQGIGYDILPVDEDERDEAEIEAGKAFFSAAGGFGRPGTMVEEATDELVEDLLVCGAISMYNRPTKARAAGIAGGKLASVEPIDAATIIPLRDEKGWVPDPPAPAFKQVLRDGTETSFTRDELLYRVWGAKTHTSYGQSFIESCMMSLLQYNAISNYNLVWYTEGDSVLGYWEYTGGDITSVERDTFDLWLAKSQKKAQTKGKPLCDLTPPVGWKYTSFRPRSEADYLETEKRLFSRIAPFFGLSATALGMEGETYKVSQETQQDQAIGVALRPIALFLDGVFTAILQGPLGLTSVKFKFDTETTDQLKIAQVLQTAGTERITINQGLDMMGLPKVKGGLADEYFTMTAMGPVVLASTDPTKQIEVATNVGEVVDEDASTDDEDDETSPDGQRGDSDTSGDDPAAGVGKAGDACRADLSRWRAKSRKAAKEGKSAQVRFQSEVIPTDWQEAINKALGEGAAPDVVFAPYLRESEARWATDLEKGLDGLTAQLEALAIEKGVAL